MSKLIYLLPITFSALFRKGFPLFILILPSVDSPSYRQKVFDLFFLDIESLFEFLSLRDVI